MDCGDGGDKRDVRRPMNAFLIFCKRHRSIVREKNPDLDNRSVTRILGDLWANLKDDEKSMYTDLAKQYKDAFMKANPDYKWHNPEKTVVPQKPTMPKPTNMKVLKNDLDLLSEGSIMPGKLADPSNMGGLSLLLIAGQQSDNQHMALESRNSDKPSETQTEETTENFNDNLNPPPSQKTVDESPERLSGGENAKKTDENGDVHAPSFNERTDVTNNTSTNGDKPDDNYVSRNVKNSSLFDLAEMCSSQLDSKEAPPIETVVKDKQRLLREAILDIKHETESGDNTHPSNSTDTINFNSKGEFGEKENVPNLSNTTEISDQDNEESAMITCGKLVVNHIIDKLYSSEIAKAARNVSRPAQGPASIKTENIGAALSEDVGETKLSENLNVVIKTDSKLTEFDEPDGWKDQETSAIKTDVDKQEVSFKTLKDIEECIKQSENDSAHQDNTESITYTEISTGRRKHLLSETGSTEGEDLEESQPVRKSRRRNRGQRYQELINEGIIQPSKERMAALQQPNPKDEMAEEDFQSIDSYILPETAIRRIRKRTTSESAKDKMYQSEDAKRYKTGDFDLEAHIATLPACPIENMGRKRGLFRSRHYSESSHIRKSPADEVQIVPAFTTEKTVSLPPHVRLPSPQRITEPVVGSRKRKARKHSITHLIPAPPVMRVDDKPSQDTSTSVESTQPPFDTHKTDGDKPLLDTSASDEDKLDNTMEVGHEKSDCNVDDHVKSDSDSNFDGIGKTLDSNYKTDSDCQEKTDSVLVKGELCDSVAGVPKPDIGCDMKDADSVGETVENGVGETVENGVGETVENGVGETVENGNGATDTDKKLKEEKDLSDSEYTQVSSKTEGQGHNVSSSGVFGVENNQESAENCLEVPTETVKIDVELGLSDKVTSGKLNERSCKSLQEVDSNIPRGGSDVIFQNEAGDAATMKPMLQDSLDKKAPIADKQETDMNFNSTIHA